MIYTSDPVKGDGYFGGSDGFHTVMYTATPSFVGTVTMQATLASAPAELDWFDVVDDKMLSMVGLYLSGYVKKTEEFILRENALTA